jgi:hypothetical protein
MNDIPPRRHSFDLERNYIDLKNNQEHNKDKENNWNSVQEKLLQSRGEQAKGYRWMHNRSCKKYTFWYNVLGITTIVVTSASGTIAFVDVGVNMTAITIVIGVFSYLGAITSSLSKFIGLRELAEKHRKSAIKLHVFISEIENQLSMKRCDRKDGKIYMEVIKNHFNKLLEEAPALGEGVLSEFRKKFGDTGISKPDIANGIDSIFIKATTASSKKEIDTSIQDEFESALKEQQKKSADESIKFQLSRGALFP